MIKAVLFDLGGVLTLNKEDYPGPKGNLKIDPETWHKAGLGLINDEDAFSEMAQNHNVNAQTIKSWLFSKRKPNNQVVNLISKLRPEIKKGIVSNSLKIIFHNFMDQYSLKDKFDVMVVSAEESVKKPDERIFKIACQKLNVKPEECLFIDNDAPHIEAAEKLGMTGLFFTDAKGLKETLLSLDLLIE